MKLLENTQEITSVPELYFTDILRGPRYTIYIKISQNRLQFHFKRSTRKLFQHRYYDCIIMHIFLNKDSYVSK
jgi:hypothetical protein